MWLCIAYAAVALMLFGACVGEAPPDDWIEWIICVCIVTLWPASLLVLLGSLLTERSRS